MSRASPAARDRAGRASPRAGYAVSAIRRPSTDAATLPFKPVPQTPSSVRLLGYEDYRVMFMPLARAEMQERVKAGDYLSPSPEHWARIQAGFYATEALLRPAKAAAAAIGFFARQMQSFSEREAAE